MRAAAAPRHRCEERDVAARDHVYRAVRCIAAIVGGSGQNARMELRIMVEPQQGATYDDQLRVAKHAERLGLRAFVRSDHFLRHGWRRPRPRPHRLVGHPRRPGS